MDIRYRDRHEAGCVLAGLLEGYAHRSDVLVLGLPRGGIPVAYEVAVALGLPLDCFVVRKLGLPGHEELAMGAIASGGVRVLNSEVIESCGVPQHVIESVAAWEGRELERRERLYRGHRTPPDISGRTVILIDDGLATGSTVRAAVAALKAQGPARIVVAVPVASGSTCEIVAGEIDELVCPFCPDPFLAVGLHYEDFTQTTDEEVQTLLDQRTAVVPVKPSAADGMAG